MDRLRTILLALPLLLLFTTQASAEIRRVPWLEDPTWDQIMARAAADSGHAILIHFHAPWCGPCRLLDVMVYNENEVVDELADVVTVKVDIEQPGSAELKQRFVIELLPTLVWCDRAGREINRFTGYRNAEEFLAEIAGFRGEEHSSRTLAERLDRQPEDGEMLLELAGLLGRRGRTERAGTLYRRAATHRDDPAVRTRALLGLALAAYRVGDVDEARTLGRRASGTGAVWTEVVAFQEASADSFGLLETYRARSLVDDMDVVALDGFARVAVALDVEMEEASSHALRAVVLSDREPEIIATLAECYYRRGLYRKAVRWLEDAVAQEPLRVAIHRGRLADYEAALAQDPWGLKAGRRR